MAEDPDQLKNVLKERAVELFNLCDQDGKGYITESELQHVIAELGLPLDASQVKQTFNELDDDENGYLTLEEFTAGFGLFLGIQSNDEGNNDLNEITSVSDPGRELFFLCDPEGKGYITKVDLERVAGDLNLNFEQLDFIFDKLDIDKNGRLTLEEFVEGFGTFLSEGNGSTEHDSSKHVDGDLNDEFTKQSLPEGHDIFESLETGPESPNYASEEALFRGIVESVGEDIFSGSLTKDQLRDLWEALRKNDVRGLQKFEEFLGKVCGEIRRAKIDSEQLESALKSKSNSHDKEVQKLYEEMELQIRTERERIRNEQIKREKALKDELVQELENKELEMQLLMQKQKSLEDEIQKKHETEQDIKSENEKLFQKTMYLEEMLNNSVSSLEDTKSYVNQLQAQTALEKKERARAAMRVSEGMQKEQASLIKQLDMLRDMNQKLRDDKDAIEAAHQAMLMAKKTKVSRQGSQMSKYVRKRRTPGAEDTWGNQGSVGSLSEEEVDGPNSSVSLPDSIREEAEFDGDPTLELISDEKLKEDERPAWAQKILSCVQPKELVEEEREDSQMRANDEELEEDVFRTRKTELISGAATNRIKKGKDDSDMSYSEGMSGETGSETDDRPNSPRAAPVGKDNEMSRVGSQDMSEAGVSAVSEHATPERVFKVVFVGDSGVGKSSFIHRFCHDAWRPSFTATIGVDFQIKTMNIDGRCIALQLWDTAGQERFRSITKQYFRKADGVIVFYDITMETSFLNIKNWMISVEEGTDDGTAIMIVGNKIDLVEDDTHRAVQSQEGKKLAEEYKALYSETSAKTGYNIPESMAEFSKMLQVREDELMQSVLNLVEEKPGKKKCCK